MATYRFFCLMPDDFTRQRETLGGERVKGQVEAQCLLDPIYDLVIGNVPGARAADNPDPSWQDHVQEASIVTTRSQAKKVGEIIPLKVLSTNGSSVVDREKPKHEQYGEL